ncbi:hypothetical protein LSH36_1506g00003 [Paralvinella palmiformis]|uniref:Uncharacterized protein n=1 Tax=Paralvinella palmiformis TaxID=53620 RepID=A0AAD9IST7_9ANNE|nr:hypothetical protein LSH36_1506g00003 [Paralvinella palmiformis]
MEFTVDAIILLFLLTNNIYLVGGDIAYERNCSDTDPYPHDIPLDAERITILHLNVDRVDYIEEFPNLTSYQIDISTLSQFPDLANVSATLTELTITSSRLSTIPVDLMIIMPLVNYIDLSYNRITCIPDLTTIFPGLQILSVYANQIVRMNRSTAITVYVSENEMSVVPNFTNVGDEFYLLDIRNNSIASVTEGTFPLMPNIYKLDLGVNKLTNFPVLHNVTSVYRLYLHSNQISSVPELPHVPNLDKLTLYDNKLTDQRNFYKKLSTPWFCPLTVMSPTITRSKITCAASCLMKERCLIFHFKNNICVTTKANGSSYISDFPQYTDWNVFSE